MPFYIYNYSHYIVLVMELAQTKAQMHETMEMKDTELQEVRTSCHSLKQENEELTQKVQKLEQTGNCRKSSLPY